MGAIVERHADLAAGELLRRLHRRIRAHHQRGIGDDRATADLAAFDFGALDARIVAPLAGVIEVGLAGFELAAVAGKARRLLVAGDVHLRALVDALLAVDPLDRDAFLGEQALGIGHELGQSLEGRGRFQTQRLGHDDSPSVNAGSVNRVAGGAGGGRLARKPRTLRAASLA